MKAFGLGKFDDCLLRFLGFDAKLSVNGFRVLCKYPQWIVFVALHKVFIVRIGKPLQVFEADKFGLSFHAANKPLQSRLQEMGLVCRFGEMI